MTAQLPFELVQLGSTVQLEPGAMITASQEQDGEVSEHSPVPYQVLLPPSAPYQVPGWTRVDRSVRDATIYYPISVEHPPYNTQLMRSTLVGQ